MFGQISPVFLDISGLDPIICSIYFSMLFRYFEHPLFQSSLRPSFCPFCDRRVPNLAAHMASAEAASAHRRRLAALVSCCPKDQERQPSEREQLFCQACKSRHAPSAVLPEWMTRAACTTCIVRAVGTTTDKGKKTKKKQKKEVVLCALCKQGKFGRACSAAGPLRGGVCDDCAAAVECFAREVLGGRGAAEARAKMDKMVAELVSEGIGKGN